MTRHLLVLLAPLLVAAAAPAAPRSVELDRIVAVVNSEAITLFELRSRLTMVERQLRGQNVQLPPRDVMEKQLLERLIVDRAQMQFARDAGMDVPDDELDAALRRIAESNRLSLPEFKEALERDGLAWRKFREEIRQEITISRLREREVENRIVISEGEIDNYLETAGQPGQNAEIVQLAHIVVRVPEQASARQLAELRARAEQAWTQLQKGEDFARVAASFSDAPDGLSGGVMEPRPADRLPTLYVEAARKLKLGETSDILKSSAGFHIIRVVDRRGGALRTQALKQTHARHILVKVNEVIPDAEARRRLVVLKERLDNGADFAELARQHSSDLSGAKGGDLGWLYQGDTVPDFEKAMDALKLNEISPPVRSPFGWHLIQVLERRTEDASKDRQRQMARQALRERKADEAYQDWLRQLRDRAYVEYRLEEK
ncbi:MAG: peptidylprolyl isomerase [Rhodocyclaceae bacterium]|jgi:peptidyl-prolyl cis-trans isomerase SurA|nr:peptidylprolyl isomerase [Rhodocyclaceae bacterium]MBK6552880.1 peptidylprolyl isomerase [Rhodocyclaceae bacterium]MBK9312415.1 peptidylprolyl isomerase [Rhodocyclaceae bacterium]